jgi:hypothetical protein
MQPRADNDPIVLVVYLGGQTEQEVKQCAIHLGGM